MNSEKQADQHCLGAALHLVQWWCCAAPGCEAKWLCVRGGAALSLDAAQRCAACNGAPARRGKM
ncbi:Hypothetical predicted protein, partial [Olea europaea subsp. europaea]